MNTNPYAPPTGAETTDRRLAGGIVFLAACWVAVIAASWLAFGVSGLPATAGLIAISWFVFSRSSNPRFYPINRKRMTVIDLLIILAICAILYGLTLPAVGSGQHRRPVVPAVPSGTNATQANGGAESPK